MHYESMWGRPRVGFIILLLLATIAFRFVPPAAHGDRIRPSPCGIALAPQAGDSEVDREIASRQARATADADPAAQLERLGWAFVRKARSTGDPGFFLLAQQAALCILRQQPSSLDAKLLAAHALHSLHHFAAATTLARELVGARNRWFDHALLGDLLMEQGDLEAAVAAYQQAMDLHPGPQMYSRAAHLRWLKGDLSGAITMMRAAAKGVSGRDAEGAAWIYSRLALYELQRKRFDAAQQWADAAVALQPDYAAALLARGRIDLARDQTGTAIEILQRAGARSRLPESLWALADALRAEHRDDEARSVEDELMATGAANDPRGFALFLATRGRQADKAVQLAKAELAARQDVFSWDALAWSRLAAGDAEGAYADMQRAVGEGTDDGRLFVHAAVIAAAAGKTAEAQAWRERAGRRRHTLLPSERALLETASLAPISTTTAATIPKEGT